MSDRPDDIGFPDGLPDQPSDFEPEVEDYRQDLAEMSRQVQDRAAELAVDSPPAVLDAGFVRACLDANERGDGVLFAALNRGRFLWRIAPDNSGEWLVWRGNVWEPDQFSESVAAVETCALAYGDQVLRLAKEIEDEGIESKKDDDGWKITVKDQFSKRMQRLRTENGAKKALFWAPIVEHELAVLEHRFDQQPWLLPVPNGVINLQTGVLETGRPDDLLSRSLDVVYDPRADYQPWVDFVAGICDDDELAAFVKRSLGYAITGFSHEQYLWVFVGPGRNGKGVLFGMVGEVLGPYYRELARGMLIEQKIDPPPNAASEHLYSLLGKRIVVGAETNRGQRIDAAQVKLLTGEDKITCRPNFRSEVSFDPTHTLFLHTNHVPAGLTSDFAMVQRLLKVEFPWMYVDDPAAEAKKKPLQAEQFRKKDPNLKKRLRDYKPGILRWLVEGCLEWQQFGISPPAKVAEWVEELTRSEDYIDEFINDCLEADAREGARISTSGMYEVFSWWWSVNKDPATKRIPQLKTITADLRTRGHKIEKSGGRYWLLGMRISEEISMEMLDDARKKSKS